MASNRQEFNILRVLLLVLATLPLIRATNIDCKGKAFHCVNSTHFMICVDIGRGLSSTVDDFLIPCPMRTECRTTNRFECEYPPAPLTTTTVPTTIQVYEMTTTDQQMKTKMFWESNNVEYQTTVSPLKDDYYVTIRETSLIKESMTTELMHSSIDEESPSAKGVLENVSQQNLDFQVSEIYIGNGPKISTTGTDNNLDAMMTVDPASAIISIPELIITESYTQVDEIKTMNDSAMDLTTENSIFLDVVTGRLSSKNIDLTADKGLGSNNLVFTTNEFNVTTETLENHLYVSPKATHISNIVAKNTEKISNSTKDNTVDNNDTVMPILSSDIFYVAGTKPSTEVRTTNYDIQDTSNTSPKSVFPIDSTVVGLLDSSTFLMNDFNSVFNTILVTTQDLKVPLTSHNLPERSGTDPTDYTLENPDSIYNMEATRLTTKTTKKESQVNALVTESIPLHFLNTPINEELMTTLGGSYTEPGNSKDDDLITDYTEKPITTASFYIFADDRSQQNADYTTQNNEGLTTKATESKKKTSTYLTDRKLNITEQFVIEPTSYDIESPDQDLIITEDSVTALPTYLKHTSKFYDNSIRPKIQISDINFTKIDQDDSYGVFLPTIANEVETGTDIFDLVDIDINSYKSSSRTLENLTLVQTAQFPLKSKEYDVKITQHQKEYPTVTKVNVNTTSIINITTNTDNQYYPVITTELISSLSFDGNSTTPSLYNMNRIDQLKEEDTDTLPINGEISNVLNNNTTNEAISATESMIENNGETYDETKARDYVLDSTLSAIEDSTTTDQTLRQSTLNDNSIIMNTLSLANHKSLDSKMTMITQSNTDIEVENNGTSFKKHVYTSKIQSGQDMTFDLENVFVSTTIAANPGVQIDQVAHITIPTNTGESVIDYDHNLGYTENYIRKETLAIQSKRGNKKSYDENRVPDNNFYNTLSKEDSATTAQGTISSTMHFKEYSKYDTEPSVNYDLENVFVSTFMPSNPGIQKDQIARINIPTNTGESFIDYDHNLGYIENHTHKETLAIQSKANKKKHDRSKVLDNSSHNTLSKEDSATTAQTTIPSTINFKEYSIYDTEPSVNYESTTWTTTKNDLRLTDLQYLNHKMPRKTQPNFIGTNPVKYAHTSQVQSRKDTTFDSQNVFVSTSMPGHPSVQIDQIAYITIPANTGETVIDYDHNLEYIENHTDKETLAIQSNTTNKKSYDNKVPDNIFYNTLSKEDSVTRAQTTIPSTINFKEHLIYDTEPSVNYESTTWTTTNNDLRLADFEYLNHMSRTTQSNLEKDIDINPVKYTQTSQVQSGQDIFDSENVFVSTSMPGNPGVQIDQIAHITIHTNMDENVIDYDHNLGYIENHTDKETLAIQTKANKKKYDRNKVLDNSSYNILSKEDSATTAQTTIPSTIDFKEYSIYDTEPSVNYESTTWTTTNNDLILADFEYLNQMARTTQSNLEIDIGTNPVKYTQTSQVQSGQDTTFDSENVFVSTSMPGHPGVQIDQIAHITLPTNTDESVIDYDHNLGYTENYIRKETLAIQSKGGSKKSYDENKVPDNNFYNILSKEYSATTAQTKISSTIHFKENSKYDTEPSLNYDLDNVFVSTSMPGNPGVQIDQIAHITIPSNMGESVIDYDHNLGYIENHTDKETLAIQSKETKKKKYDRNKVLDNISHNTLSKEDSATTAQTTIPSSSKENLKYDTEPSVNYESTTLTTIKNDLHLAAFEYLNHKMPRTTQSKLEKDVGTNPLKYVHTSQVQSEQDTTFDLENVFVSTSLASDPDIVIEQIAHINVPTATAKRVTDYNTKLGETGNNIHKETHTLIESSLSQTTNIDTNISVSAFTTPTDGANDNIVIVTTESLGSSRLSNMKTMTSLTNSSENLTLQHSTENLIPVTSIQRTTDRSDNASYKDFKARIKSENYKNNLLFPTEKNSSSNTNGNKSDSTRYYTVNNTDITSNTSTVFELNAPTTNTDSNNLTGTTLNKKLSQTQHSTLQTNIKITQKDDNKYSTFQTKGEVLNEVISNKDMPMNVDINVHKSITKTDSKEKQDVYLILNINENKRASGNTNYNKVDNNLAYNKNFTTPAFYPLPEVVLRTYSNNPVKENKDITTEHYSENQHNRPFLNIINMTNKINASDEMFQKDTTSFKTDEGNKLAKYALSSQKITDPVNKNQQTGNVTSEVQNIKAINSKLHNDQNIKLNFDCLYSYRGRYADKENCRKFYICIGKQYPIIGMCPVNTVFSELRKQCTKNLSHCIRNYTFYCTSDGRFSDIFNNNIYYICVKNTEKKFVRYTLQCENGYQLNKDLIKCVPNVKTQSTVDSVYSQRSSDTSVTNSNESRRITNKGVDFKCEQNGKFPDPNNCRKYYVCSKNKLSFRRKLKSCDSDEVFDKHKEKCVDAESDD